MSRQVALIVTTAFEGIKYLYLCMGVRNRMKVLQRTGNEGDLRTRTLCRNKEGEKRSVEGRNVQTGGGRREMF